MRRRIAAPWPCTWDDFLVGGCRAAMNLEQINALRRLQSLFEPLDELLTTQKKLPAPPEFRDTHRLKVIFRETFEHLPIDGVLAEPRCNLMVDGRRQRPTRHVINCPFRKPDRASRWLSRFPSAWGTRRGCASCGRRRTT